MYAALGGLWHSEKNVTTSAITHPCSLAQSSHKITFVPVSSKRVKDAFSSVPSQEILLYDWDARTSCWYHHTKRHPKAGRRVPSNRSSLIVILPE
jgi:hypothetical protein